MVLELEYTNPELATMAVYQLGGAITPIDLEDIAIEVFKYAPNRFSWRKYQDRIDLRIVLYAIQDAKKKEYRFLKGGSQYGYMITEIGIRWVSKQENKEIHTLSSRKLSLVDIADKEIDRLKRTSAYKKHISGEKDRITLMDFREFTRVNDYFPQKLKEQRFSKINNLISNDPELKDLWAYLIEQFQ